MVWLFSQEDSSKTIIRLRKLAKIVLKKIRTLLIIKYIYLPMVKNQHAIIVDNYTNIYSSYNNFYLMSFYLCKTDTLWRVTLLRSSPLDPGTTETTHTETVGWLFFRFNGLLRQYFSLYRAISQRKGVRWSWVNFQCRGVLQF